MAGRPTILQRIQAKIVKVPGPLRSKCWLWMGATCGPGYAQIKLAVRGGRRTAMVHRWMYEHYVEPIPRGLEIDHLCCTKACVNPRHVEPVTHRENIRRYHHTFTACPRGHDYTEANTRITPQGTRRCRACQRIGQRQWHARHRKAG